MQFRDHPAVQGKRDFYPVDPKKLNIDDGYNVRDMRSKETREHIAALKASISENGVRVPLEVRLDGDEDIVVVAGHCRLAAVMELISEGHQIKTVPCIPEAKGTNDEERTLNLVVSNSGKPLAPLEIAKVVRRLRDFGWEDGDIAKRLGWKSSASVKQHIDMLGMPADVKGMVRRGEVSATTAVKAVRKEGAAAADTLRQAKESQEAAGKSRVTPRAVRQANAEREPERQLERAAEEKGRLPPATPAQRPANLDHIIDALEPFAQCESINHLDGGDTRASVPVGVEHIRRAAALWRKLSGHDDATPAQPTNGSAAEHASATA